MWAVSSNQESTHGKLMSALWDTFLNNHCAQIVFSAVTQFIFIVRNASYRKFKTDIKIFLFDFS
jgi:hypothetical protein